MRSELLELLAFTCCLVSSPLVLFSFLTVKLSQLVWFNLISFVYPNLEFLKGTTLRTLTDTHRNQGVITVLLTLRGPANVEAVRIHLQEVVNRTDKLGNLVFPRLRDCLVTRCGIYGWQRGANYDLEQNLIVTPFTFRGRIISDINIQDCVSDIVSKYLPSGVPPWQIAIIPSSDQQHYILLRIHHVLLTENLTIADLLPLKSKKYNGAKIPKSPLRNVFRKLTNLPVLQERLTEDFTNAWNEFIANYDPLEKTELLKTSPGYFEFLAILLITSVSSWREFRKGDAFITNDLSSKVRYLATTIRKECQKRKVNVKTYLTSILVTLHPYNVIFGIVSNILSLLASALKLPFKVYNEVRALYTCIKLQYCAYPNTAIGFIYNYAPLFFYSLQEVWYCLKVVYKAPKNILEEIFSYQDTIQTVTLCGRKVVAWSPPVKTEHVSHIAKQIGVSETEIVLAACSSGISHYFEKIQDDAPPEISITARNINSNYIFSKETYAKNTIGGMLCLDLPILESKKDISPLENLQKINSNLQKSLDKQPLTYLLSVMQTKHGILSKLFPATSIEVFLRCLSLKYSVLFTEVTTKYPNLVQQSVWNEDVMSAVYWRPPQANISISLCVNQYDDHMVLGVMADAQLAPHHQVLVRRFPEHLSDLATAAGIH